MSSAIAVSDANFEQEVLESELPVLVDFWATWCGPCRVLGPIVEEVAEEYSGQIKVVKLDVDQNPAISTEYGIRSLPTIMFFKDGRQVDTVVGAVPRATLMKTLDKYL